MAMKLRRGEGNAQERTRVLGMTREERLAGAADGVRALHVLKEFFEDPSVPLEAQDDLRGMLGQSEADIPEFLERAIVTHSWLLHRYQGEEDSTHDAAQY